MRQKFLNIKRKSVWLLLTFLVGCTSLLVSQLDQQYGKSNDARYLHPIAPVAGVPEYRHDVRPILEQRCTVCHGCYDAPCQQNLTSWQGIARGANPDMVYGTRLSETDPTRLFIDAQTPMQWRQKNFHPVLNERQNTIEANLQGSALYRLLDLKRKNPLPDQTVLDDKTFTFSLDREQTCPAIEKMDGFEKDHPQWGMPYGLPALSQSEFSTVEKWLAVGSPVAEPKPLPSVIQTQLTQWEIFFNGKTLKQKLMSRYIYEHLYLAHLYFDQTIPVKNDERYFFRLVRSSTPPGTPISEIATRRPYDDPGTESFWYRLRLDENTVVEKTHMPYALNKTRQSKWTSLFLTANYKVDKLPSYAPEITGNPFIVFEALPINTRYRFMLDEAQFTVDTFIKGPVCRGQVALSVIDEHFWVFFVNPDTMASQETETFLAHESKNLRLPAEDESNASIVNWLKYSKLQQNYLEAKQKQMEKIISSPNKVTLNLVWSGDGKNNAALTVFRHMDSASVVKGLAGQPPKTAWVISYPLFERIYYLLVAGFDIYGNVGHQLNTRLYMDFLRMEGESNFLTLLPIDARTTLRNYWYRGASDDVKNYLYGEKFDFDVDSGIDYKSSDAFDQQKELYTMLVHYLGKDAGTIFSLNNVNDPSLQALLTQLQNVHGEALAVFPQNSILRINAGGKPPQYFTLINNSGFSNISSLFDETKRRRPQEDYLTVVPGIIGAYPNAFFDVSVNALNDFINRLTNLKTDADYTALADAFAIRRTNPEFWDFSDALQQYYKQSQPITGGVLDYNRFENR